MDWQVALTIAAIVLAAGHVGWRGLRLLRGSARQRCGGCAACPSAKTPVESRRVVPLDLSRATAVDSKTLPSSRP